jgi:N,N-dimethylformamidase
VSSSTIRGYCDRPSVAPGETLKFYVSGDPPSDYEPTLVRITNGDANPAGPGFKEECLESDLAARYPGRRQRTQIGSYAEVPASPALTPHYGMTVHAFIWMSRVDDRRQGVISCWADDTRGGWALIVEEGFLTFQIGDGQGSVSRVASDRAIFPGVWYAVTAGFDSYHEELTLQQRHVITSVNSRFGPVVPLDSATRVTRAAVNGLTDPTVPLIIGGLVESVASERTWCTAIFDGKVDAPRLYACAIGSAEADVLARGDSLPGTSPEASWDFARGIDESGVATDEVTDVSGNGHTGRCVNQPDRAVTGWNWSGAEEKFTHARAEYGAVWFHSASLDDCRWEQSFTLSVPDRLRSGCYAIRLRGGGGEDYVPFFVRPVSNAHRAKVLLLVPTLTYVIYGNTQVIRSWSEGSGWDPSEAIEPPTPLSPSDLEHLRAPDDYGLSPYDTHSDGSGVKYASWRRPLVDMRPKRSFTYNYQLDLQLVDWLEAIGIDYDVATDHDLASAGADVLRGYKVVLTGSHPEYYTAGMIDAWEAYLSEGGRGMYLGGNGMYWVTAIHPAKPWLAEIRRGETGDAHWHSLPGEQYLSFTAEKGGLWKHRGRAPQKVWGTGYASHGFDQSGYFTRLPDAADARVAWIFEGLDDQEVIGDFGLAGGGAGGYEMDVYDQALGTPPHTMLLAASVGHSVNARLVPDEMLLAHPGMNGEEHPRVRADMTYFTTANGGAMFATSSIAWCGSLSWNGYQNNVATVTRNVIERFTTDDPLPPVL